ncbi:hypothetical protein MAUB1S_07976 [Mycolicibacterium aubagnense]
MSKIAGGPGFPANGGCASAEVRRSCRAAGVLRPENRLCGKAPFRIYAGRERLRPHTPHRRFSSPRGRSRRSRRRPLHGAAQGDGIDTRAAFEMRQDQDGGSVDGGGIVGRDERRRRQRIGKGKQSVHREVLGRAETGKPAGALSRTGRARTRPGHSLPLRHGDSRHETSARPCGGALVEGQPNRRPVAVNVYWLAAIVSSTAASELRYSYSRSSCR